MNILLIDDDTLIRRSVARVLLQNGHEVFTAEDGIRGLELYHRQKFDLIITDIYMPRQEGIETILTLRRNDPDTKIIAISGGGNTGTSDALEMARLLGANATLEKPFRTDQLLAKIKAVMTGPAAE
ncbi:MAG TPA: response regulator [Stellaceae bacterium]|jgi:DNA-binding response OmpR family regulator|nr:response regulator [Stellaceae bacterium]